MTYLNEFDERGEGLLCKGGELGLDECPRAVSFVQREERGWISPLFIIFEPGLGESRGKGWEGRCWAYEGEMYWVTGWSDIWFTVLVV